MNKVWAALALAAIGVPVMAQQSNILYAPGKSIKDQNIGLRNWGSGTIGETDEMAFEGTLSLRVSTRNYFQGGQMMFANPVDLTNNFSDKNSLLRLTFKAPDASTTFGGGGGAGSDFGGGGKGGGGITAGQRGGGAGGGSSAAPPAQSGGNAAFGSPPGAAGQGRTPGAGTPGSTGASANPVLRNMRLIVTTSDGKKSETYVAVATSSAGERGWRTVAVPLQAINGFDKTNKQIKEIAFSGDSTGTFYIGDIRVVNDTTPIRGDVSVHSLNLALGQEVNLSATGFGGSSILKYRWDFDDSDGIQVDAEGQAIKRRFRKAGKFKITMTVVDAYGLKEPYSTTIDVTVNP